MLTENYEELVDNCVDQLKTWKKLIGKYLDDDEKAKEVEKLKKTATGFCEIDEQFNRHQKVFDKIDIYLEHNDEDPSTVDVDKIFDEMLKNEPVSSTSNLSHNRIWQTLFHNDEDIMIVEKKEKKQLRDNQFEEVDDSLLCSNVFTPPVDPISKVVIRNPFRNKKCKHVYEHLTIIDYIKQLGRKAKCPYIGCKNINLRTTDLVEDNELQSNITQYLDTQQDSQTSDSD